MDIGNSKGNINSEEEIGNIASLKLLSVEDRIKKLYKYTPHSLPRLCMQCIEIGIEEPMTNPINIVYDIIYAIDFFAEKAKGHNQIAINTLTDFSTHIQEEGRLRKHFAESFVMDMADFDKLIQNAYQNAINRLYPKHVDVVEGITKDIVSLLQDPTEHE